MPIKNFNQPLKNIDGSVVKTIDQAGKVIKEETTLKELIIFCLMNNGEEEEKTLDATEKLKRFLLAQKIYSTDEVDILPEEISYIKELTGKKLSTLAVGQLYQYLNS